MLGDGDDCFCLIVGGDLMTTLQQGPSELRVGKGDAVGVLNTEPAKGMFPENGWTALAAPRATFTPFVRDIYDKAMRLIPRNNEALRLLVKYSSTLREEPNQMSAELRHLAVTHIHDLMAMALGAMRDGAAIDNARGVRAARLEAIKADILDNLASPNLAVGDVARRQGVTSRYIHMLFESEGITFSEFVCEARLKRTHGMLLDPRFCDQTIMTIAFAAGFGDLSYFNRCFRRRFGAAPSELRCDVCPRNSTRSR
jgi:AraC-like DNA-binding protein